MDLLVIKTNKKSSKTFEKIRAEWNQMAGLKKA